MTIARAETNKARLALCQAGLFYPSITESQLFYHVLGLFG